MFGVSADGLQGILDTETKEYCIVSYYSTV
jgi:hypothetical protein